MPGKSLREPRRYTIAIHGGAGAVPRAMLSQLREQRYRAGLEAALDGGFALLERGGSALDAVTAAVRVLEDGPCLNARHGAALTRDGAAELDAAIIGAGTYAKNGVCAVSATGHGEYFIRAVAAHHVCAAVEYRALSLEQAVREMLHGILPALGGDGGLIALGGDGKIVMDFSTEGMFRGARDSAGRREIAIY